MSHEFQFYAVLVGIAMIGLLPLVMRFRAVKRSSWPTWLFVPLAVWVALPLLSYSKPPDPCQPFCFVLIVLVLARWAVAVVFRERSRGWILYLFVLVVGPFIIIPAIEVLSRRFTP